MNYPLISEYVEAIRLSEENLEQLNHLRPVLDSDGNPVMSSGNFAVVFKMRSERDGKCYALKCFIKDQPGRNESYRLIAVELEFVSSDFLVPIKFCDKELFVDTDACSETEFPVVVMDWVEGITLDRYVRKNLHDQHALQMLTYQFCRMASWLMSQPFAHGDLKPDNILVRDDGSLVLVDYDGMYVPAMQGQKARELGSPDYRHPARTEEDFNEHIDDFSLAAIAMQLCAISLDPSLLPDGQGDTLLLSEADHRDLPNSDIHARLHSLLSNPDFERLYALYHLAHAQQTLSNTSFRTFLISKPKKNAELRNLSTKVTDEDLENGVRDEFGALYSPDGLRLLKGANIAHYHIRQGTKVICDSAFSGCKDLTTIDIPESILLIGVKAFCVCEKLNKIDLPKCIISIGSFSFDGCTDLTEITIPFSLKHIGENPFRSSGVVAVTCYSPHFETDKHALYSKERKKLIFFYHTDTSSFNVPNQVSEIGNSSFYGNKTLTKVTISSNVVTIGDYAFYGCEKLSSINIPHTIQVINDCTFFGCSSLSSILIPNSVTNICAGAFGYSGLINLLIPPSVIRIDRVAFNHCKCLRAIFVPSSVQFISYNAFEDCNQLEVVFVHHKQMACLIPNNVRPFLVELPSTEIHDDDIANGIYDEYGAIYSPDGLRLLNGTSVEVDDYSIRPGTITICDNAFSCNSKITSLHLPPTIKSIGKYAFACMNLVQIDVPSTFVLHDDTIFALTSNLNNELLDSFMILENRRPLTKKEKELIVSGLVVPGEKGLSCQFTMAFGGRIFFPIDNSSICHIGDSVDIDTISVMEYKIKGSGLTINKILV